MIEGSDMKTMLSVLDDCGHETDVIRTRTNLRGQHFDVYDSRPISIQSKIEALKLGMASGF